VPAAKRRNPARQGATAARQRPETPKADQRRSRLILASAVFASAIMLVAWFPFSALLGQRQQLNAAQAQLNSLKAQDASLASQEKTLTSPGDVTRLAREQYQLVQPGQRLVQVLPPSGTPDQGVAGQAPYPGDPGLTKPVAPSAIALLPTTTTTTPSSTSTTGASRAHRQSRSTTSQGFFQRVVSTLAFWRR